MKTKVKFGAIFTFFISVAAAAAFAGQADFRTGKVTVRPKGTISPIAGVNLSAAEQPVPAGRSAGDNQSGAFKAPVQLKKWLYGVQVYAPDTWPCGGVTFIGVVALTEVVPATGSAVVVSLRSSRPEILKVPATVSVPPGEGAAKFNVATIPIAQSAGGITIVATVGADTAVSNTFGIRGPRVTNLAGSPGGPCNGQKVTFTATLDCPGPAEPVTVSFSASGRATGSGSENVGPGDTKVSHKITFARCCLGNGPCPWSVYAFGNNASVAKASGHCGQPTSCPNW